MPEFWIELGWPFNAIFDEVTVNIPAVLLITELFPGMVMVDPVRALNEPLLLTVHAPELKVIGVDVALKTPELVMVLPVPELKLSVEDVAVKLPELVSGEEPPPLIVKVEALDRLKLPLLMIGVELPEIVMVDAFNDILPELVSD